MVNREGDAFDLGFAITPANGATSGGFSIQTNAVVKPDAGDEYFLAPVGMQLPDGTKLRASRTRTSRTRGKACRELMLSGQE